MDDGAASSTEGTLNKSRSVFLVCSSELVSVADTLPAVPERATLVHSLIASYGLVTHDLCGNRLQLPDVQVESCVGAMLVPPVRATPAELAAVHTSDFVHALLGAESVDDAIDANRVTRSNEVPSTSASAADPYEFVDESVEQNPLKRFGLDYDCAVFPGLSDYVSLIAGASLTAARCLTSTTSSVQQFSQTDSNGTAPIAPIAINWCGGWHHARRDCAAGFCYVNDAALAIAELLRRFSRVLYVDLDIHHADGVQRIFERDSRVFTLSVHLHAPGFYPCTGDSDAGGLELPLHSPLEQFFLNVPLREGASNDTFVELVCFALDRVLPTFRPEALVVQCGADSLAGDPLVGQLGFKLTLDGYGR